MMLRDGSATACAALILSACGSTAGGSLFSPTATIYASGGDSSGSTGGVTYVLPESGGEPSFDSGGSSGVGGDLDPGTGGAPVLDAGSADAGGLPNPTGCNFSGTWATYITVPVNWPAAPLVLLAGTGSLQQWDLSHQAQDGINVNATTTPCGIFLPDLTADVLGGGARFGIRFPNTLFDLGDVPWVPFVMHGTISATGIGFATDPFAILMGVDLANPVDVTWPAVSAMKLVDHDLDGKPGVTVVPATGSGYSFPPTDLSGDHADLVYIAERTISNLQGSFAGCDQASGAVNLLPLGGGTGIDSSVVGCRKTDGTECTASDASFVNSIRPVYKPTGAGTFVSAKLAKNATCADVRARFPKQ